MTIEDLIAAANPVPADTIGSGDSPRARQILTRILSTPGQAPGARQIGSTTPRRWRGATGIRLGLVTGGLAIVGVTSLVVPSLLAGSPVRPAHGPRPHTVTAALEALAAVASSQPVTHPPRLGQFEYTDEKSLMLAGTMMSPKVSFNVSYIERRQAWIALNGAGRIVESHSDPDLISPKDVAGWIAAGRPSLRIAPVDQRYKAGGLWVNPKVAKLPTDPAKLAALLMARKIEGGPPGPAEDFVQIGDLLRENYVPPAVRAAIFKVAERIPGARLLGTVTDQAGRSGIGIAHWQRLAARGQVPGQVDESVLIFNRTTSALLAEETFVTYTKTHQTVLTSWTAYLKSGVVNSITSTTPITGSGSQSGPAGRPTGGNRDADTGPWLLPADRR